MEGTPIVERLDEFAAKYAERGPGTLIIMSTPRKKRAPAKCAGRPNKTGKRATVCKIKKDGSTELLCVIQEANGSDLYQAIVGHKKVNLPAGVKIDTGEKETFIPVQKNRERKITVVVNPLKAPDGTAHSYHAKVFGVPEKCCGNKPYSVVDHSLEKIKRILADDPDIKFPNNIHITGEGIYQYVSC
ncbi:MAG: hypothetical protein UV60_C0001G0033 [Parcubacteria group bacterium GW2011_GWA2_43_11]|nr:MAG: hypothetical protein UU89_C0006G0034 [Parcubacteria group bacterium GW2011_GWC2_42_11]KKS86434.1 MAG: hypothetical protein UV60_C0001G0033 [Parcubacteria group bacterium GW2011_GWA2_43_11]